MNYHLKLNYLSNRVLRCLTKPIAGKVIEILFNCHRNILALTIAHPNRSAFNRGLFCLHDMKGGGSPTWTFGRS